MLLRRYTSEPGVHALLATSIAVAADYAFVPALRSTTPVVVSVFLLCLLARHLCFDTYGTSACHRLMSWRLICFVLLHLSMAAAFGILRESPSAAAATGGSLLPLTVVRKFVVFVPSAILLPASEWQRFGRSYRAESIAAVVALLTFSPYRLFAVAWPVYSQMLGHFVHSLAGFFVPGLCYQAKGDPVLIGPALGVEIVTGCSGLNGLRLFQDLFALLLLMDWDRLRRWRAFVGYFGGMAWMLLANALRIALMVVLGNRVSADLVIRYHLNAGWLFFVSAVLVYVLMTYRWLVGIRSTAPDKPGTLLTTQ